MEYNPKDGKSLTDSDTVLKQKRADSEMVSKKGIAFYCSKRHEFIFIENTKAQTLSLHKPKKILVDEINSHKKLKEWQDQD